ncbi:MAG: Hsp20/alpha crystallin family protein [Deltaproteobacteria bacterium]|nr:Hsp20/alpha crystallin family protein [Deltaproteobacteria bacterium]
MRLELRGVEPERYRHFGCRRHLDGVGFARAVDEEHDRESRGPDATYATFKHSLTLPKGAKRSEISAPYQHGVLKLTMPASPELMGRKIPIEIGREEGTQIEHQTA